MSSKIIWMCVYIYTLSLIEIYKFYKRFENNYNYSAYVPI